MTANQHDQLNLVQKIAKVQADIGEVKKEGHNKQQGYDYVSEAQVKKLIRQPLAELGVIIIPSYSIVNEWNDTTRKGTSIHYASVLGSFELTDGNESKIGTMPGTGMDMGDKAVYKAETGAQKNYLMQLFMISTGDDPEQDISQQVQQNNYRSNNYSNNNYRNNNARRNIPQNDGIPKLSDQPIKKKKFDQILLMINQVSDYWGIDRQNTYDQIREKYHFNNLNSITNKIADQILIYLGNATKQSKVQSDGSNG